MKAFEEERHAIVTVTVATYYIRISLRMGGTRNSSAYSSIQWHTVLLGSLSNSFVLVQLKQVCLVLL